MKLLLPTLHLTPYNLGESISERYHSEFEINSLFNDCLRFFVIFDVGGI